VRQRYAEKLGPIFAQHGYVFLYLYRHGEGLSIGSGKFIGDELAAEERANGLAGRRELQFQLLTSSHFHDGMAGIAYLKGRSDVDAARVAVIGHSFGGQLALLEAERDPSLRAVVMFGAATDSWARSPKLRARLLSAVSNVQSPVLLVYAANDYSTAPGRALASELARLGKSHVLRIYPPFGDTPAQGHSFLYYDRGWEADVFRFLDTELHPDQRAGRGRAP
jgi:dienelactone hydrolase